MSNKAIANWLIAVFAIVTLSVLDGGNEFFELVGGLMFWVFGIWAVVRLYKTEN